MELYAKTLNKGNIKQGETIQEHTEELLKEYDKLKSLYFPEINQKKSYDNFWEDLKIVCLFHDLGKISTPFQNKIRKSLGLKKLKSNSYNEIPHNYISPSFLVGISELGRKENLIQLYRLVMVIAFHHERPLDFDKVELEKCIRKDINNLYKQISSWLKIKFHDYSNGKLPKAFYYDLIKEFIEGNNETVDKIKQENDFVLLKGLLHRLDYAASAHLPVETSRLGETTQPLINYLNKKYGAKSLKTFQLKAADYRNESVIMTASTGIGKTEFAINWLGDSKGFYTLPLRVSSNSMHTRLSEIFEPEKVGLLHSDSISYELENNETLSIEDNIHKINISRQLSLPFTVTTADQLFTAVFKWPGYERIYATLAYSKIILDEPQGYSPKTLAMIIRCLEEIAKLGAKFCYMSATNHPFIVNRLQNTAKKLQPQFNTEKKHKIEIVDSEINQLQERFLSEFDNNKKILVITNTVKKSQQLYEELSEINRNVKLLHSGFIKSDRAEKEKEIQEDFKKNKPVIWISTQIVEASLDIDYDILFTEAATLDALVQRMGRIYRKQGRTISDNDSPNIVIATSEPSDKYYIYEKAITNRTINALNHYHKEILTDKNKQDLMDEVYKEEEIKETKFFKDFLSAYSLLEYGYQAGSKNEAQKLFREISQINGIPAEVYEENYERIDELIKLVKSKNNYNARIKANYELNSYTLSVPAWRKNQSSELMVSKDKSKSIFLIPGKYDSKKGLRIDEIDNIF